MTMKGNAMMTRDELLKKLETSYGHLCGENLSGVDFRGLDLSGLCLQGADLRGADLRDVDLRHVILHHADLRGADLRGAKLYNADLSDANIHGAKYVIDAPIIPNIHRTLYDAVINNASHFDMETWHAEGECGTTHCRAGWTVILAGERGEALEKELGTGVAAALIYAASDPELERIPNWMSDNETALDDMRRLAEKEAQS